MDPGRTADNTRFTIASVPGRVKSRESTSHSTAVSPRSRNFPVVAAFIAPIGGRMQPIERPVSSESRRDVSSTSCA